MAQEEKAGAMVRLRAALPGLSATERRVAEWILTQPEHLLEASMLDVAQACKVSDTTVLRMCRNSDFAGFTDLKLALARDLASPMQLIHDDITTDDSPAIILAKVFSRTALSLEHTLEVLQESSFLQALDLLDGAGTVLIGGVGTSGVVGQSFYQRCHRAGVRADAPQDSQLQIMHAAMLSPGDLAVAISYSGATMAVIAMAEEAKRAGAAVLVVTGNRDSPLADLGDVVLQSVSHETRSEPLAARICQMTLLDALSVAYSHRHLSDVLRLDVLAGQAIVKSSY